MKLSQMSTEQSFCKLAELLVPISNILEDENLEKEMKKISDVYKSGTTVMKVGAMVTKSLLPLIFKHRRTDLFKIISVMSDKTVDQVAKQNLLITMKEVTELFDKELIDFFISLRASAKSV